MFNVFKQFLKSIWRYTHMKIFIIYVNKLRLFINILLVRYPIYSKIYEHQFKSPNIFSSCKYF